MTDREAKKALIDRAYEARRKGDLEGLVAAFSPDVRFTITGSKQLTPAAGSVQGHNDLRGMLGGLISTFEFLQRDLVNVVMEGDQCACHSRVKVRCIPKDKTVTTEILDLFKFANGQIVEFTEFVDTALVNDLTR